jgi:hypothetical protein
VAAVIRYHAFNTLAQDVAKTLRELMTPVVSAAFLKEGYVLEGTICTTPRVVRP